MAVLPKLQIRSNLLIAYNHSDQSPRPRLMQSKLYEQMREVATYSGVLTPGAKKRLTKAIELLVMSTRASLIYNPVTGNYQYLGLVFLTLTVSETARNLTGKEAHAKLLEPLLQWMRRTHGVKSYVWKAELQKRGQIHYHVTFDKFIHWRDVRTKWNELQLKAGLLETDHIKYHYKRKHRKNYKPYDPPSVEIRSVKKNGSLCGYLIKEIVKHFQNDKTIDGKIWDCSLNLKLHKYYTVECDYWVEKKITEMVEKRQAIFIKSEHCRIWRVISGQPYNVLEGLNYYLYNLHLDNIKDVGTAVRKPKAIKQIAAEIVLQNPDIKQKQPAIQQQLFDYKYGFNSFFSTS